MSIGIKMFELTMFGWIFEQSGITSFKLWTYVLITYTDVYWTIHASVGVVIMGYPMFGSKQLHDRMLTYNEFDT